MTAPELIEILPTMPRLLRHLPPDSPLTALTIVRTLLDDPPPAKAPVCEASVHLPRSGSIWVASFTGSHGGQIWKSTGLTDRDQALVLARRWEAEARAQRIRLGRPARRPTLRVRREPSGTAKSGMLTQKEVALLLTQESAGWTTRARSGFPLPFRRGEGQGEGSGENSLTGQAFPLTPTLSPSAGALDLN